MGTSPTVGPAGRWVVEAVAAVLTAEHTGAPVSPIGPAPEGVLDAVVAHRVTTLLADHAEALGLGEEAVLELEAARRDEVLLGLATIVHTRSMSETLTDAGVDHLVVKGTALASMVGRGAATRGSGDIDTWVRPADLAVAEAALAAAGWRRSSSTLGLPAAGVGWRWRLVERLGWEVPLTNPQRGTVDLHWRLTHDPHELGFGFEEAWDASVAIPELGSANRGLCPMHALEHVAYHGRKEHFCIVRQCVDVLDLVRICGSVEAADLARRSGNVALALEVVAPLAPPPGVPTVPSARVRRLAAEARADVGSLAWTLNSQWSATGLGRAPTRLRRESWMVRSAPSVSVAARHLAGMVVPVRLLADAAPVSHRRRH